MFVKRFTRPFRRLQGKLTLSYTLTSVVTFLLIELTFITGVLLYVSGNSSLIVLNNVKQAALQGSPYFIHSAPDPAELTSWLRIVGGQLSNQGPFSNQPAFLTVVDAHGQSLASIGSHPTATRTQIDTQLSAQSQADLHSVLSDPKGATSLVSQGADGNLVAITPIVDGGGTVRGVLLMKDTVPNVLQLAWVFLRVILVTVAVVTAIAVIAGVVFGYLLARGLTRRLRRLFVAADGWSNGDFSAVVEDNSEDELGQLSRQLNRMARQLQALMQTRQSLATAEERNRLARDLHDSVKQQIFAVGMQIGATRVLLDRDVAAAEVRLNEADRLVHQAQQELTLLIRELRPAALEGKSLVAALRELTIQFAQQTELVANLQVEGTQPIAATPEEALYRVAQEALSNVHRHSGATAVQLLLTVGGEDVTLSVSDNGQGFSAEDSERRSGIGLLSMQERMRALGGDVQVESAPGKGTRVVAHCKREVMGSTGTNAGSGISGGPDHGATEAKGLTTTEAARL